MNESQQRNQAVCRQSIQVSTTQLKACKTNVEWLDCERVIASMMPL